MKAILRIVLLTALLPVFALAADAVPAASTGFNFAALLNGDVLMGLLTVISTLFGIWKHNAASASDKELTLSQKINQSLVLGIETASKIPEVIAAENKMKAIIQAKATEYGVQPALHRIVQDLTEPAAASGGTTDSHS